MDIARQDVKASSLLNVRKKTSVVVLVHEVYGLTDWAKEMADKLADEGFIVIAPDLLSGNGPHAGSFESRMLAGHIFEQSSPEGIAGRCEVPLAGWPCQIAASTPIAAAIRMGLILFLPGCRHRVTCVHSCDLSTCAYNGCSFSGAGTETEDLKH